MFMRLCSAICLRTDGHGVEAGPGKRRNHGVREVELRLSLMPANSTRAYLIACLHFRSSLQGESSWSEDDGREGERRPGTDQFCLVRTTSSWPPTC